jgi:hypothetical protein
MESKIIEWIQCDNKIKEYNNKSKKYKDRRNELCNDICSAIEDKDKSEIPTYNLESLNISITPTINNSYENYNNKFYLECFTEFLNDEEKASELLSFMKSKREIKKTYSIKRDVIH